MCLFKIKRHLLEYKPYRCPLYSLIYLTILLKRRDLPIILNKPVLSKRLIVEFSVPFRYRFIDRLPIILLFLDDLHSKPAAEAATPPIIIPREIRFKICPPPYQICNSSSENRSSNELSVPSSST